MPAKKPVSSTTSEGSAKPEPSKAEPSKMPAAATGNRAAGVFALVAICVIVAVVVMTVRGGSEPTTEVAAADAKVAAASSTAPQPTAAAPPTVKKPAKTGTDATAPSGSVVPASSSALSATVTVAGCLERSDNGFRLKNTSGADAPQSRSWKTGFFTKRSASIELSDQRGSAHLAEHLGERVSVTGALIDRELIVHSLRSVAASCK